MHLHTQAHTHISSRYNLPSLSAMQRLPASTEPTNNKQNANNNNKCNKKQSKRETVEIEGKQNKAQSEEMATAEELIATTKYKIDEAKNIMKNN